VTQTVTDINEIAQRLQDFGVEVMIKDGELLVPSYVVHVSVVYGDLQLRQGKYEITYINSSKRLCVYNENDKCLEIYLPKTASIRFYHGFLIIS